MRLLIWAFTCSGDEMLDTYVAICLAFSLTPLFYLFFKLEVSSKLIYKKK